MLVAGLFMRINKPRQGYWRDLPGFVPKGVGLHKSASTSGSPPTELQALICDDGHVASDRVTVTGRKLHQPTRFMRGRMGGMSTYEAKKGLVLIIAGFLLSVVCGTLVGIGLILSWYPPYRSFSAFLKFVFHPITLLFFVGMWLIYKGVFMLDAARK